jgi:AcrR family transcriptional regulator
VTGTPRRGRRTTTGTAKGAPRRTGAGRNRRGRPGYDLDALLGVAIGVFTERGYDGTTMEDLAAALGITKSSIYHHVSGKQEILARALDRALTGLEAVLGDARASADPAAARLERAVRDSVATLIAELPSVTLLLRVRGNTEVERAALERRRRIDGELAELVTAAQGEGDLRPDLDPALVARLVFGTVNSLIEWYRPRDDAAPDRIADTVCAMVFDGLHRR